MDEEEEEEEEEDFDERGVEIEEDQEPEQEQGGEMQHQEVLFMPEIASDDERAAYDQQRAEENVNVSGRATKRRKSQLDISVHQVAKRRRCEVSGEDSHIQPARDKGKDKAATDEDEEDNTYDLLFSISSVLDNQLALSLVLMMNRCYLRPLRQTTLDPRTPCLLQTEHWPKIQRGVSSRLSHS